MKKIKTVTVVGTRPEIIRLSLIIKLLDKETDHSLIHTGQNYDHRLNEIFFKDLGLKQPKFKIQSKDINSTKTISKILTSVDEILDSVKPDAFIILGDTNSCLSAYCAKRRKIPIFHVEAGNRCYDQRVPEEINRKIIDHISDINITYSTIAKNNLLRENIDPDKIFKIGSPLFQVFDYYKSKINKSNILKKLRVSKNNYYLVSVHREENIENQKNISKFFNFLNYLNKKNKKIIVSTHPRTMKKIKSKKLKNLKNIIFSKPFSYSDYAKLQINAKYVFSDSGSITEESSIMGFKSINLRNTNERQEGMTHGTVPMSHFNINTIDQILKIKKKKITIIDEYKSPNFSDVFYNILMSYFNYINENTWRLER